MQFRWEPFLKHFRCISDSNYCVIYIKVCHKIKYFEIKFLIQIMLQCARVAKCMCCKVHVLQIACVANYMCCNCTCCVSQIAPVPNCTCCKLNMLQSERNIWKLNFRNLSTLDLKISSNFYLRNLWTLNLGNLSNLDKKNLSNQNNSRNISNT